MKSFPIKINGIEIMSDDIYSFVRAGNRTDAMSYIIKKTNCTYEQADEVITELITLAKTKFNRVEETKVESKKTIYIDATNSKIERNVPKCPTCGSTNIKPISSTKRAASILGFGILSKNIGKTYECFNCKYKW